ncbi:DNA-directed RNA polymerase subunit H [Candidatus Woesearchaeota archaeon]|jgi:DNA-directed RNA polymerase subunit H|nr:DNA-directed RNA polymerase subunit H [Candidatus Woesearchaeota archaeon]MBT5740421.1 DNA-directed RNA polymerase subunit H [Candidatus Woesearchaeota archaeon]
MTAKTHTLVPKHTKASDAEKKRVLAEHNISVWQLPRISQEDPAILALKVEVGDVIRIERESRTAGKAIYYRVVME